MARKMKTMDGNMAAAHVAYAFTEVAAIYPITPSSPMADYTDQWADMGRKNIFGQRVLLSEMQSEGGAAGAVHGSLQAGALTTTYTASQGLLLMIPNMYKIAGELLPCVIHVAARTIASHALSIFGDHSDVYACRQTGFAMLCAGSVQEVMDLGAIAHLAAIEGRVPFLHYFDGFRTSHEIQKIAIWDYDELKEMCNMKAVQAFKERALNPEHPVQRGTAQNPDIFFQTREASNSYYDAIPGIVEKYMNMVNEKAGTNYKLFNYYGDPQATKIIIAMGSVCDTAEETIDYMRNRGEKTGLIRVRLFRPFCAKHLISEIPDTVENIYVLDRSKEPGAQGEALYLDVVSALRGTKFHRVPVFGGRYGLASKDTTPADILAVFANADKERFTIGIHDDVTNLSLERPENPVTANERTTSCKFWGLGADGTVGANKNSIKIIGDNTDKYVQAYFDYDSKKSGGVTISHLRFGDNPIKSTYLIHKADFVACHMPAYVKKYDMVQDLKDGGAFLLNCPWDEKELENYLPGKMKRFLALHNIQFYIIDGFSLGRKIGLGGRINTILQAAFFAITHIIPVEDAIKYMKEAAEKTYKAKGDDVVQMNYEAIDAGIENFHKIEIPDSWAESFDEQMDVSVTGDKKDVVDYVNRIQKAINTQNGNNLPVSVFVDYADGTMPAGSAAFEKRSVAVEVPLWNPEGCIQCNFCSFVCPHSCIRPVAMKDEEAKSAPTDRIMELRGVDGLKFAVSITVEDCTGCGNCAQICPGNRKNQVLSMVPYDEGHYQQELYEFGLGIDNTESVLEKFPVTTVKGSQYRQPLLEFSGACGGCGETSYAKLLTQLFGERMYIANATGCTSIWGGSSPSSPYTVNREGKGPAWANSLFEDNAEFGYGMLLAQKANRSRVVEAAQNLVEKLRDGKLKESVRRYLDTLEDSRENAFAAEKMISSLNDYSYDTEEKSDVQEILNLKDFATKKSQWIFGGDGWGYDIGYGGLDHVLASGEDVNVMVFDTEVYSNTGGQASKATPAGAIAQFAASGKQTPKKDLAAIAMTYGYIYVAQVSLGADMNQLIKACVEAENYPGPSLIIAYAPCINHGIKGGMKNMLAEEKLAVESGYWHLFRYNPMLAKEGKNPLIMDSQQPSKDYREFLMGEIRYNRLFRANREQAERLFARAEQVAERKYHMLKESSSK
ncbi:MAG: pyruvate:ferredoxin (flavodoxin) oxidoreductase [Eubacterium sp.]|nr:pyruvate:ferredoxin (flavodoxin) oxidoreductase [Eubacterium sp.]